jgi:hypothetical protein
MEITLKHYSNIESNLKCQYLPAGANFICRMVDDHEPAPQHAYVQNVVEEVSFFRRVTTPGVISVPRGEPNP